MSQNVLLGTDDQVPRYLEEYFKRFDIKLVDGESLNGCRLLVWGIGDIIVEAERGDKYLIPRHSIRYITLEHAVAQPS